MDCGEFTRPCISPSQMSTAPFRTRLFREDKRLFMDFRHRAFILRLREARIVLRKICMRN
jgi:hypothetical protein